MVMEGIVRARKSGTEAYFFIDFWFLSLANLVQEGLVELFVVALTLAHLRSRTLACKLTFQPNPSSPLSSS